MKLTFVSLPAFPVVQPSSTGIYGGTETRAVTLAQGLARFPEHEITFLARHPDLSASQTINEVTWSPWRDFWTEQNARLAASISRQSTFPYLSFRYFDWSLLGMLPLVLLRRLFMPSARGPWQNDETLLSQETDLFCVFGVHSASAKVIYNAQRRGKKTVLFLGSDSDIDPRYAGEQRFRNTYGERSEVCHWVLKHADRIIAQNAHQREILREHFDREAELLNNPLDLEAWQRGLEHSGEFELPAENYVLWIGRAEQVPKRSDWAFEVAQRCPELPFVIVLNPREDTLEKQLRADASKNVTILKQVPFSQMPSLFARARLLLNTSSFEGFPNTFLQAAASEVPIVSTEIDAGFVKSAEAGLVADGTIDGTVAAIHQISNDPALARKLGQHGRNYVQQHHSLKVISKQLADMLEQTNP